VLRCCMAATVVAAAAGRVSAQAAPQSLRVTPENARVNSYLHDLAGPGAFLGVIGGGLVEGLRQKNPDAESVAGRIGSHAAQAAVQVSVRHGLAALMHRSTDYQPCECSGFGRKVEHALRETFTDRRADGSRALSVPRLGSAYAGSFARLAWERGQTAGDAALGATVSLGFTALFNIGRELTGLAR
jgi:hypothetical protein